MLLVEQNSIRGASVKIRFIKQIKMGVAMFEFRHHGNFDNLEKFLKKAQRNDFFSSLDKYARAGVSALVSATPIDSGKTADSWDYEIHQSRGSVSINFTNSNINDGVPIAIILQYGHGTRNGGYVQGRDYINPAIRPIFDKIANEVWKEVTSS